jgi:hypothetical protein
MGENSCLLYIRQGTDNQNTQGAQNTKHPQKPRTQLRVIGLVQLNRTFSKVEVQMAKKKHEKSSPSLAIKEIQIKTTVRFHLTPVRIAAMKNTNNKCRRCKEKRNSHTLLMGT